MNSKNNQQSNAENKEIKKIPQRYKEFSADKPGKTQKPNVEVKPKK